MLSVLLGIQLNSVILIHSYRIHTMWKTGSEGLAWVEKQLPREVLEGKVPTHGRWDAEGGWGRRLQTLGDCIHPFIQGVGHALLSY